MSSRRLACLALCAALHACVSVDDGRADRDQPTAGAGAGTSVSGAGGSASTAGTAGMPHNPGGVGGLDGPAPLDVDSIFDNGCAQTSAIAQLPQVNLLFVLDRSKSMECNPPPLTTSTQCETDLTRADMEMPNKWEITREALSAAIRALPSKTVVGISYFSNGDACGVHSRPRIALRPLMPQHIAAIDASLSTVVPSGATPLVGATILAYRHLHDAALQGRVSGDSFVVLLTDGEQSDECNDPMRCADAQSCTELLVNDEVGKASGPGVNIRTFVIGVPGSEPAVNVLSQIALKGGTAREGCDASIGDCHFDMSNSLDTFASDLALTLEQIVGRALSCELPLPEGTQGADRDTVNVVYSSSAPNVTPRVVPYDDTMPCGEGADGWQYSDGAKSVRLCGRACDQAREDDAGRIDVVLGCPVQGPQ
jgi:hypothetical protein